MLVVGIYPKFLQADDIVVCVRNSSCYCLHTLWAVLRNEFKTPRRMCQGGLHMGDEGRDSDQQFKERTRILVSVMLEKLVVESKERSV